MKEDRIGAKRQAIWAERLSQYQDRLGDDRGLIVEGRLTRMVGLTLEAIGCRAAIGGQCDVVSSNGTHIEAEVVGFGEESLYLMPTGNIQGLEQGARVIPTGRVCEAVVGEQLLGRVIDGAGKPLDGLGALH
ncbi:MAG: flagellum-specific ATP synthase FliI, partial [Candidatus Thiodiazotropha sp.]